MAEVAPFAAAGDAADAAAHQDRHPHDAAQRGPGARHPAPARPSRPASTRPARARAFSYFVLSDTNDPAVAAAEEQAVAAWKAADPDRDRIVYRRRTDNTGYKAGNVRDFCERWGGDYELMLPLDADSLMSGDADRAPRAHDAGPSQDRHPAEPRRRHAVVERRSRASSSSACATACAPTPWARRGGSAIAARSGATTRWCASSRSTSSAICRCCPASRRSAAMCSRTIRSRRP